MPSDSQLETELKQNVIEIKRYALEIMDLDPPMALTAFFEVAAETLIKEFPQGHQIALLDLAFVRILQDIVAERMKGN